MKKKFTAVLKHLGGVLSTDENRKEFVEDTKFISGKRQQNTIYLRNQIHKTSI